MDNPISYDVPWYSTLQAQTLSLILPIMVLLATIVIFTINSLSSKLIEEQTYQKLAHTGQEIVSELENDMIYATSLVTVMSEIATELAIDSDALQTLIDQIMNNENAKRILIGAGIWPKNVSSQTNSLFWRRDSHHHLQLVNNANKAEKIDYHHEEWYVATQYLQKGQVYWSKPYLDPHSLQPIVTIAAPMYEGTKIIGATTLDLKLQGLQTLLENATNKFGGYAFILDRDDRILSFSNNNLMAPIQLTNAGELSPFTKITTLIDPKSQLKPLSALLKQHEDLSASNEKRYAQLAKKIISQSDKIDSAEANLIAEILLTPPVITNNLSLHEKHTILPQGSFLQEAAYISVTTIPETLWRVVTMIPPSVTAKAFTNTFSTFIFIITLSSLVATLLIWFVLRQKFMRPFAQFAQQLKTCIQNTTDSTLSNKINNKNELGIFTPCFNQYAEQVVKAKKEAELLAFFDLLTGLPNRRLLLDRLREKQAIANRQNINGAVMSIDLDHFKVLNDSLGHSTGDHLLIQASKRLKQCLRDSDTVAHIGGDEFVIVTLFDKANKDHANEHFQSVTVAQKILKNMSKPFNLSGTSYHMTVSIGISLFSLKTSQDTDKIIKQADTAMYQAKTNGRNNFCFFDHSMKNKAGERLRIQEQLRHAINNSELELHYQPQVIENGDCYSVEALVRWHHPIEGMIPPNIFIPVAEESILIIDLGTWVLNTACEQMFQWNQQGFALQHVAVNVSPRQFEQQNFIETVKSALHKSQIKPQQLMLEITEGVILNDANKTIEKMHELRAIGVTISMDDFGTGYSSLTYLKLLPLDQLKIDQSFVRDINTNTNDAVIVEMVITMGQQFGYQVIAEGVETKAQQLLLKEKRCEHYQGYYFSRPLPVKELEIYLSKAKDTHKKILETIR